MLRVPNNSVFLERKREKKPLDWFPSKTEGKKEECGNRKTDKISGMIYGVRGKVGK